MTRTEHGIFDHIIYGPDGMRALARLYYGGGAATLPDPSFRYSHSDLDGEVVVERVSFPYGGRDVSISAFSYGYLVQVVERDQGTRVPVRETTYSYHALGLPRPLLDLLAAGGETGGDDRYGINELGGLVWGL